THTYTLPLHDALPIFCQFADFFSRAVSRAIVNEDQLPRLTCTIHHFLDAPIEFGKIINLIVDRSNDRVRNFHVLFFLLSFTGSFKERFLNFVGGALNCSSPLSGNGGIPSTRRRKYSMTTAAEAKTGTINSAPRMPHRIVAVKIATKINASFMCRLRPIMMGR